MNKAELISAMAKKTDLSIKSSGDVLNALTEIISNELANGGSVQLVGFGTFETRKRAARTGRNPQTGAVLNISESTVPAFRAGKSLREEVNK